jgi:hypothetical protein
MHRDDEASCGGVDEASCSGDDEASCGGDDAPHARMIFLGSPSLGHLVLIQGFPLLQHTQHM